MSPQDLYDDNRLWFSTWIFFVSRVKQGRLSSVLSHISPNMWQITDSWQINSCQHSPCGWLTKQSHTSSSIFFSFSSDRIVIQRYLFPNHRGVCAKSELLNTFVLTPCGCYEGFMSQDYSV